MSARDLDVEDRAASAHLRASIVELKGESEIDEARHADVDVGSDR